MKRVLYLTVTKPAVGLLFDGRFSVASRSPCVVRVETDLTPRQVRNIGGTNVLRVRSHLQPPYRKHVVAA